MLPSTGHFFKVFFCLFVLLTSSERKVREAGEGEGTLVRTGTNLFHKHFSTLDVTIHTQFTDEFVLGRHQTLWLFLEKSETVQVRVL